MMNYMMNAMMSGMKIISNPLAVDVRTKWKVVANPVRKRRKNWRVVCEKTSWPTAYVAYGGTIIAHPEIVAQLRKTAL